MKLLTDNDKILLDKLIEMDIVFIEKGFKISDFTGRLFLQNSINSFKNEYLRKIYGDCIFSFSTEYRYFIIGLLKNIDDKYKDSALSEVLIATTGYVTSDELLKILNNNVNI